MTIKSTFVWTSVHTAIKILSGIVMNKVIAVYLGPSGLALIGQFQNFTQMVSGIANGSIQTGIIKYTAEYRDNEKYLNKIIKNTLFINLFLSFIVSIFIFIFAYPLSKKVMFTDDYVSVFYFLGFSMVFYALNLYVISILNGLGEIKLYTIINILISITTLILTTVLTIMYRMNGALFAIILAQSSVFGISFTIMLKKFGSKFFSLKEIRQNIDKKVLKNMFKFSAATYLSGFIMSFLMMSLRYMIQNQMSLDEAGVWDGVWRIKNYFALFFMMPFSIYYFPKFSYTKDFVRIKMYLFEALKYLMPIALLLAFLMYMFRELMVATLFSDKFFEITDIIGYVLMGEVIRMPASFIQNIFMAKANIAIVIISELSFALFMIFLSYIFLNKYSLIGLGYAYIISSILFTVIMVLLSKRIKL